MFRFRPFSVPCMLVVIFFAFAFADSALAQKRKFKEGQDCLYLQFGEWKPAIVTATEKDMVEYQYEFGGRIQTDVANRDELRFPWELRAITRVRTWKDESGKFSIQAAAVGLDTEKGEVVLHKLEDDSEITVPIASLSKTDRDFLIRAEENAGPKIPELPAKVEFMLDLSFKSHPWSTAADLSGLPPDPFQIPPELPMAGVVFPRIDFFESVNRLIPIGGTDGWMAAGTSSSMDQAPSRLMWVSLTDKSVRTLNALPIGEVLVAVDPASRQALTFSDADRGKGKATLTLWNSDPQTKTAVPRIRWVSDSDKFGSPDKWAEFVAADLILHRWARGQYVLWNTAEEREVYRFGQESFFVAEPQFSPGRNYLVLPEDNRVRVLDISNGDTLVTLPTQGRALGVGFDREGKKLAVLTTEKLYVWTFGSGEKPYECRSDGLGSVFGATVDWVDSETLLIGKTVLFDLKQGMSIWNYRLAHWNVKEDHWGDRTMSVAGGKLCYVATAKEGDEDMYVVGAVELPGPQVRETVAKVNPDELFIIHRGDKIKLELKCGEFDSEVKTSLNAIVEKCGWVIDPAATNVLEAEMGIGGTQSATYEFQDGSQQTLSVTPYFSSLKVVCDGEVAWSNGINSGGLPPVIFVRGNESVQNNMNANQRPYPEFFKGQNVPEKIFNPKYKLGFGTTEIGLRGLVPVEVRLPSTTTQKTPDQ